MKQIKNNTLEWARAAGIRALRTVAQAALATIGASAAMSDVDWQLVGSVALLAGIISLLMAVANLPEVDTYKE